MALLDKYNLSANPPKIVKARAKSDPMVKINQKFLAGLEKQLAQAKAWKPGAKDLRSWVTRDVENDQAWVTVKYGPWNVPIKGAKSTLGPVKISEVTKVFADIKKAHSAGELETGLKKAAVRGPKKKAAKK